MLHLLHAFTSLHVSFYIFAICKVSRNKLTVTRAQAMYCFTRFVKGDDNGFHKDKNVLLYYSIARYKCS